MSHSAALNCLKEIFGYESFRGQQEAVVEHLIAGQDALVLMPTGAGKSLCYQVPALIRDGMAVVVSPLVALMHDQVEALQLVGVKAHYLSANLSWSEMLAIEAQVRAGQVDLLYVAPERLLSDRCLSLLEQTEIALFAIDEAHCVSQWGHDFRPEYLQLSILHQRWANVPRIALTATATLETKQEIAERLELTEAKHFIASFDRPNIHYQIVEKQNVKQQLVKFIAQQERDASGIVYCLSRNRTENIASYLEEQGLKALPYHAGLNPQTRQANQSRFLREEGIVIVATVAFGMGINKPDVRFVAHVDMPRSIEAYYQETGRAGRDGLPATAWMAYGLQDVVQQKKMIDESNGNEIFKTRSTQSLNAMLALCESSTCRRVQLLAYFGQQIESCGNCDVCLAPPKMWDATVAAQKVMSCIYRLDRQKGQRYGAGHIIDILRGQQSERTARHDHEKLSVFGVGKEFNPQQWRTIIRQLLAQQYLVTDIEGYGTFALTQKCRAILKNETQLMLREFSKNSKNKMTYQRNKIESELSEEDFILYEKLRLWRNELANEQGIPPYQIFNNNTLKEIAVSRPMDEFGLKQISGIGQKKLEEYGQDVLDLI